VVEPVALAGGAGSLTGKPSGEDDDGLTAMAETSNIVIDPGIRPSLGELPAAPFVGFAEPEVLEAGEVESVVEEAGS
jgi:hypothetical protein